MVMKAIYLMPIPNPSACTFQPLTAAAKQLYQEQQPPHLWLSFILKEGSEDLPAQTENQLRNVNQIHVSL